MSSAGIYQRILIDRANAPKFPPRADSFFTSVDGFDAALIWQAWEEVNMKRPLRRMAADLARALYGMESA